MTEDERREILQQLLNEGGPRALALTALLVEYSDYKGRAKAADDALDGVLAQIKRTDREIEELRRQIRDAEYGMACLATDLEELQAERDKAVTAFDRIALDPAEYRHALSHIEACEDNCEQCRRLATDALERGVDGQERAADLIIELAQLRATMIAARRYRETHLAIQGLPGELVPHHMLEEVWAARDAFDAALKVLDGEPS